MTAPTRTATTRTPRTLTEVFRDAILDQARRILASIDDEEQRCAVRDSLAELAATAHERLHCEIDEEQRKGGRRDPRSAFVILWLDTSAGRGELTRVRIRDLVDQDGQPIDPRITVADLRLQLQGAPDDLSGLDAL